LRITSLRALRLCERYSFVPSLSFSCYILLDKIFDTYAGPVVPDEPEEESEEELEEESDEESDDGHKKEGYYQFNLNIIPFITPDKKFERGYGTELVPYIITTVTHLNNVREFSNSNLHFKLGNNINLQNTQWTPIASFNGNFDGNGYSISNLKMTYTSNDSLGYGLFSNNNGTIKNLKVTANINFQNFSSGYVELMKSVGVIAVNNYGTIENSQVSSSGNDPMIYCKKFFTGAVGGITARNYGSINSCKNNGIIYSSGDTGGIAGYIMGVIANCENNAGLYYTYVASHNAATHSVGGMAGINYNDITNGKNRSIILYGGSSQVNDNLLQPRMAHITGSNYGTISGSSWSGGTVNKGNLITFSWTQNGGTYTHNQALYVRDAATGLY